MLVAPTEPPSLKHLGRTSSKPETYGVDFLFFYNREPYGIQRKELSDLIASMQDGRLAKEVAQMKRLTASMLIVEGRILWTLDGKLAGRQYGQDINKNGLRGILWSIQNRGIILTHTESISETSDCIQAFEAYIRKGKHQALDRRPGPQSVWGKPDDEDYGRHLLMGLPGVGPEIAGRIYKEYGVPWQWTIGIKELMEIEGIGKKKAESIYQAIHEIED